MALCTGIRADGGRCGAQAMQGSTFCIGHDPEQAEARRRRASKGGKRGGRGRPQVELQDIKRRLSDLGDAVLEGEVDKSVGAVVSQILNVYLKAISVELQAHDQLVVVERMEKLEEALEQQQQERGYGT